MKTLLPPGIRNLAIFLSVMAVGALAAFSAPFSVQARPVIETPDPPSQKGITNSQEALIPVTGSQSDYLDAGASAAWNIAPANTPSMSVSSSFDVGSGAPWLGSSKNTFWPIPANHHNVPADQWIQSRSSGGGR